MRILEWMKSEIRKSKSENRKGRFRFRISIFGFRISCLRHNSENRSAGEPPLQSSLSLQPSCKARKTGGKGYPEARGAGKMRKELPIGTGSGSLTWH
jgi:hypothetical protein